MTYEEVKHAQQHLGHDRRAALWEQCMKAGHHDLAQTDTNVPQTYCRNCLTTFARDGMAVDAPA